MKNFLKVAALVVSVILAGCGGGGGGTSTPTPPTTPPTQPPVVTPIAVKASSYENKIAATAVTGQATIGDSDATAFADFFQNGTYSAVSHTLEYDPTNSTTASKVGHIKFYQQINGVWVDNTTKLLADNTGCLHPRKAVVADLNNDSKPDVFFACHGFDAPPYAGEKQRILLSQADGKYKNVTTTFDCYCHGASAAVMNKVGAADILVADQMVEKRPYFLLNSGAGTFTKDTSKLPSSLANLQIWTAELMDFNGDSKYDAFLAGAEPGVVQQMVNVQQNPTIYYNDGANSFLTTSKTLPADATAGLTLDVVLVGKDAYLLRTSYDQQNHYGLIDVQKVNLDTLQSSIVYSHQGDYAGTNSKWFPWISLMPNKIVSFAAKYGVQISI